MPDITSVWFAIGLDITMIIYTLWVVSLGKGNGKLPVDIGIGMLAWLALLHLGLSTKSMFPAELSGIAFLALVFAAVGAVGAMLLLLPQIRDRLLALDQQQLMLMQGIRVFFGANFLMMASLGSLPKTFGILDGWTHIAAGFFGLIAAFALARGADGIRRAWFANIFGLADILIVASTLSLILLPTITPYHTMMYAVFLPAPLWLWFHLISIWKLLNHHHIPGQELNA
ncbi:MAG: hypothetical protein EPN17_07665 [Methylobacter sp.]|nr:MAG: hypothetical protein EPN17_07665 [Methylobacter sp.]